MFSKNTNFVWLEMFKHRLWKYRFSIEL
jgi:hypothetical protein